MPVYQFYVYEVDSNYYSTGNGFVLGSDVLSISDTDADLHASAAADPGGDQSFSFASEPAVVSYNVSYLDYAQINAGAPAYEVYAMTVSLSGAGTKYYVLSKDAGFAPSPGDQIDITTFSTFASARYDELGSAVCFAAGTRVLTAEGMRPVERLRPGDLVQTMDNGAQPLLWVTRRHVNQLEMRLFPKLRPIWLKPGFAGNKRPLIVSQQHRLLTRLDGNEHLMAARLFPMCNAGGARLARGKRKITYFHLLLARHEILFAEGIPVESLATGPGSLRSLTAKDRLILQSRFPELFARDRAAPFVRPVLRLGDLSSGRGRLTLFSQRRA